MRIGIITQPLKSNYGGIIQNWALQQILKKLGHDPITIDALPRNLQYFNFFWENFKTIISFFIPNKHRRYHPLYMERPQVFESFVKKNIITTEKCRKRRSTLIPQYNIEALIVGSDQVWRPMYNIGCLDDMYLRFAHPFNIPKMAYAASFGTDKWEYNYKQSKKFKHYISLINHISVREYSGVKLCKTHFDVDAKVVLDPTLLLEKSDYMDLISDTPIFCDRPFLGAYILNNNKELLNKIKEESNSRNLVPIIISADNNATITIEQWLSIFRDAQYIITDSFHGSVFSFLFDKEFKYIINQKRGASRFRVIEELINKGNLEEKKNNSINFLRKINEKAIS